MATFHIKKGRDIRIKGAAAKEIVEIALPNQVAVQPPDFKGLKLRLLAKENDTVKVGSPVLEDKINQEIVLTSPVSGKVVAVNRGDKRALLEVVIETDGNQEAENFKKYSEGEIPSLVSEVITKQLLKSGLWPVLRQRPFSKIANPGDKPKAIFVHAMNTEPLALDSDFILKDKAKEFQIGLDILKKLADCNLYICAHLNSASEILKSAQGAEIHYFDGPHPAGNVSTHIHHIDPINKGDIVWYLEVQDVLRVAQLFLSGIYPTERIIAITGEGAQNKVYAKTIVGAPLSALLQGSDLKNMRCISGSILTGRSVGANGFVRFYDSQVTVIPEGGVRELLGWLVPGFSKYTFSKTFVSSFLGDKEYSIDTDENGGHRAIVLNHIYDSLVPLDIMTYFLIKAIVAGDIDEAERLGILECDEEDFALCTFACPSKTDVGAYIKDGLNLIELEG